jgi:hypothetical protein
MVDSLLSKAVPHNLGTSADYLRGDGIWTAFAHGASDHTDTTHSLFVPVSQMIVNGGTAVTLGAGDDQLATVNLADGATQGIYTLVGFPLGMPDNTAVIRPVWTPSATDAAGTAAVRWTMNQRTLTAGADVTAAGTVATWTGDAAAKTANRRVVETGTAGISLVGAAQLRLALSRVGADAADTYVGDVRLLGIRVDFTMDA